MAPLLYRFWVGASTVLVPFAARVAISKLRRAGVPVVRCHEKLGHATEPRDPDAPLVWFHAASVGETQAVLALIGRMGHALPAARFLITSGTATSAAMVARRMPPRCVHQFSPLDAPGPLRRFLRHWRPDAAIFVESELWPQMLRRTHARGTRMALVNARLSAKSIANWRRFPKTARYLFEVFDLILTQNDAMAEAMVEINAPADRVARGINLKSLAGPLPRDEDTLFEARAALGHRPVWIASSTHPGEEQTVLAAHKALLERYPDLCLILVPRHPDRGQEVTGLIADAGLSLTRRTRGDMPGGQVFLADTLGELGTWYALGDIVFLGGSLRPIGGHNPFEVAQAGAAVLSGNHVTNFAETFAEMEARGAARLVADARDIAERVGALLDDPAALEAVRAAASAFTRDRTDMLDSIAERLIKALELAPRA
ncbi:3-deoxy-D-manno-octulosonic acid transferase [Sulfitobacter alexandrii]|uniref:3-deoxy-D-manno-octulosonic acid transferase n=1 Tax=Sulfitobacter alexandrii TaxID=1917485 RepID=A0A1J0WFK0_9RHOB|nr:3-deoxy-D-manno-octulosonic acid transferase [Sulfitobacter alexandrii]APE43097.1 3-deoxy-D-manno-octulosonic acid transferase [Sulfitobacter alexandrii]